MSGFQLDESASADKAHLPKYSMRRRLRENLSRPVLSYWRELEPFRREGVYSRHLRIREIKREVKDRPAYIMFERPFYDELQKDERVVQARDSFLSFGGEWRKLEKDALEEELRIRRETSSLLPLDPRARLQRKLGKDILNFWVAKDKTRREELVEFYDLRNDLYDQGQDETPEEFEERRIKAKRKFRDVQPLEHYKMRMFRDLVDARAEYLIRRWRERTPSFSRFGR